MRMNWEGNPCEHQMTFDLRWTAVINRTMYILKYEIHPFSHILRTMMLINYFILVIWSPQMTSDLTKGKRLCNHMIHFHTVNKKYEWTVDILKYPFFKLFRWPTKSRKDSFMKSTWQNSQGAMPWMALSDTLTTLQLCHCCKAAIMLCPTTFQT